MDFKPLKLVISLYLIRFDGLDGYFIHFAFIFSAVTVTQFFYRFIQNTQQNNFRGNKMFSFGGFGLNEVYINGRK